MATAAEKKKAAEAEAKAAETSNTEPATNAGFVYLGNGKFNGYVRGDVIPAELFDKKPNKLKHMLATQQIKKA